MSRPHAVIIAGGEGLRLGGVRKSDLRIGGVRQVDRVVAALGDVVGPVMLASGPAGRMMAVPDSCVTVPDLDVPCGGPLAGLAAAIDWLAGKGIVEGLLASVAVDTPFLPPDFVERMRAALGTAPAVFAAWGEDFYPPNAIWRIESVLALPGRIACGEGPASLKALQREMGAQRLDWAVDHAANPFRNINTVADLVALQRIARARRGSSSVIHMPGN